MIILIIELSIVVVLLSAMLITHRTAKIKEAEIYMDRSLMYKRLSNEDYKKGKHEQAMIHTVISIQCLQEHDRLMGY